MKEAEKQGISEDELISDIQNGEIFRCVHSVIAVGLTYTVYCQCRLKSQYIIKNADIKRISCKVVREESCEIGTFYSYAEFFYVIIVTEVLQLKMWCMSYGELTVINKYHSIQRFLHPECEIDDKASYEIIVK